MSSTVALSSFENYSMFVVTQSGELITVLVSSNLIDYEYMSYKTVLNSKLFKLMTTTQQNIDIASQQKNSVIVKRETTENKSTVVCS